MRYIFFLVAIIIPILHAVGQNQEDSVKMVVNHLFDAMKNADAAKVREVFTENSILQTVTRTKEGKVVVQDEKISEFADFVGKQAKNAADERISFEIIKIDGPLAIVWTPYRFYFNGKFSHCGVNSFQLVKIDGKWKIQYLIDTRRRLGCEE